MERELVSERQFKRQIECVRERLCMESVQQKILKSAENFAHIHSTTSGLRWRPAA
jgi:hypothetical protein